MSKTNWTPCQRKNANGFPCGRPGVALFTSFECTGTMCCNYSQALRDIWDEETRAEREKRLAEAFDVDPWSFDDTKPGVSLEVAELFADAESSITENVVADTDDPHERLDRMFAELDGYFDSLLFGGG